MLLKTKRNWGNHKNNWELLDEALRKNSPKLGIIASWGIFEKEAKLKSINPGLIITKTPKKPAITATHL